MSQIKLTKKDGKCIYILRRGEISHLKEAYKNYRWKFPSITFHERYVTYDYVDNTRFDFLKYLYFVMKCIKHNAFFYDDTIQNVVNGVLIDYNATDRVPRIVGLLGCILGLVQELDETSIIRKILFRRNFFGKYFRYMYDVKITKDEMICENQYRTVLYDNYLNIKRDTKNDRS